MDKFSELKAAAMAATPGPWGIDRTGNTIVSNQYHPLATVSDAFHRQLAGGGVGKDAEFIAAANPAAVLALLAELEAKDKRIAELEAIRADASQVFKEIGNELGCNPDNESIMMAIDDLKATQMTGPLALIIKRAEEMERILEGITPVMIAGGWTAKGISDYAKSLEAKLATPVRLPRPGFVTCSGERHYTYGADEVKGAIRAAGFTVEGMSRCQS